MSGTIGEGDGAEKRTGPRPVVPYLGAVKIAAGVMGVAIIAGVIGLVVVVAKRMDTGPAPAAQTSAQQTTLRVPATLPAAGSAPRAFGEVTLSLPPRARVEQMAMDGRRLVLHLWLAGNQRALMVVDLDTGAPLGLIRLEPEPLRQ